MFTRMYVKANTWLHGDEGATATEYGLLVALIALGIIVGVGAFGGALNSFFDELKTTVNGW